MMNYEAIIQEEKDNRDKIYLYPMKSISAWMAFEVSAERLHMLFPNIPYGTREYLSGSVRLTLKAMLIDRVSLEYLFQFVSFTKENERRVIDWTPDLPYHFTLLRIN